MKQWITLASSNCGTRADNEDYVESRAYSYRRRRIEALVACDGIGGRPNGKDCATTVGQAALQMADNYLRKRRSRRALNREDLQQLVRRLHALRLHGINPQSGSTLALVLFDLNEQKQGYNALVIWAGDTRVNLLDIAGQTRQLTKDHHDAEGCLTTYLNGDGKVCGKLGAEYFTFSTLPCVISVTTDGIHDHCQPYELYQFLLYCLGQRFQRTEQLSAALSQFLQRNISDNYSAILLYRSLADDQIRKVAARLSEVNSANTNP